MREVIEKVDGGPDGEHRSKDVLACNTPTERRTEEWVKREEEDNKILRNHCEIWSNYLEKASHQNDRETPVDQILKRLRIEAERLERPVIY
jgi:hypothetical protein